MITPLHRHDLAFLSPAGQDYAWTHRAVQPGDDALQDFFSRLPGICRVQPPQLPDSVAALGFSLPIRRQESRWRISTQCPREEIRRILTPWDIPAYLSALPAPVGPALTQLARAAAGCSVPFGVFGSAALQAVTGLPYLHSHSDLDVVIGTAPVPQIKAFYAQLLALSRRFSLHIDGELMLSDTCYLKIHELMQGHKTILAKGTYQPRLIPCQEVWDTIAAMPQ